MTNKELSKPFKMLTSLMEVHGENPFRIKNYAQALMQIMLRFGMAHTIVLDHDSKFFATFKATCELIELSTHTLSSSNHDPMIVERVNRFLNKALKTLMQEWHNNLC